MIRLKIALVLAKMCFLGLKKGISELMSRIAPKHTANIILLDELHPKQELLEGYCHSEKGKHDYLLLLCVDHYNTISLTKKLVIFYREFAVS